MLKTVSQMTNKKETLVLEYKGILTFDKIEELLTKLKKNIFISDTKLTIQKRINSILIESLENSYRHNVVINDIPKEILIEVVFIEEENSFEIRIGNFISNDKIEFLVDKIDLVNSLDKRGLNELYCDSISKSVISEEGGAGLGIIDMSRNSGRLLKYELSLEQDFYSFFKIIILVSKKPNNSIIMNPLIIKETITTPKIIFDYNNNNFIIEGCSRPENVRDFFNPVIQWLMDFKKSINENSDKTTPIVFKFIFDYFNSSSAKFILDILVLINDIHSTGLNVGVDWCFEEEDEDMKEVGEELSEVVDFPFSYIIIKNKL